MLLHRLLASALIPLSGLPRDMEQVGHDRDADVLVAGGEGDLDEAAPRRVHEAELPDEVPA